MVAQTTELPNIRKLFLPDPGYIIADCDLAQADAQVVAWEADDDELKAIFQDPTADLHNENAKTIFGTLTKRNRQLAKTGVHAVNYGAKARTLAAALGITTHEAEFFINRWFAAHPGIREWHRRVEHDLETTRQVSNRFGNVRYYFDRIEHLLPEALAWVPQSTVALVINRALVEVDRQLHGKVELLMQVHDSLVMQIPKQYFPSILPELKRCMEVTIPYDDPLIIPVGIDVSDKSWGDVEKYDWSDLLCSTVAITGRISPQNTNG